GAASPRAALGARDEADGRPVPALARGGRRQGEDAPCARQRAGAPVLPQPGNDGRAAHHAREGAGVRLQENTRLALYSVLEFAAQPARRLAAAEIASRYDVSPHHLAKVLKRLRRAGILAAARGAGGGYRF